MCKSFTEFGAWFGLRGVDVGPWLVAWWPEGPTLILTNSLVIAECGKVFDPIRWLHVLKERGGVDQLDAGGAGSDGLLTVGTMKLHIVGLIAAVEALVAGFGEDSMTETLLLWSILAMWHEKGLSLLPASGVRAPRRPFLHLFPTIITLNSDIGVGV